eukprot:COSAG02_NODE_52594_length_307_cov_0.312500_1_plen_76_part_00
MSRLFLFWTETLRTETAGQDRAGAGGCELLAHGTLPTEAHTLAGESQRLVIESAGPLFTSELQRCWHPPRLNPQP